jgi:putative ABC transport system substrate-binding protein
LVDFYKNYFIVVLLVLGLSFFISCSGNEETKTTENIQKESSEDIEKEESVNIKEESEKIDLSEKKVVIVNDVKGDPLTEISIEKSKELYMEKGIKEENINIFGNDEKTKEDILNEIKALNPDVVQLVPGIPEFIRNDLIGTDIPTVVSIIAEMNSDENDIPKDNIFGIRSQPKDLPGKILNVVNGITSISGKKVSFIQKKEPTNIKMEQVKPFTDKFEAELGKFIEVENYEETLEAAQELEDDPETDIIIIGGLPTYMADGSLANYSELLENTSNIVNKPTATFLENYVSSGVLCGATLDIENTFGTQTANMALDYLNGKEIKDMVVQEPEKINIVFNKQIAEKLGLTIPEDMYKAAFRVYTDTEGNFIGK